LPHPAHPQRFILSIAISLAIGTSLIIPTAKAAADAAITRQAEFELNIPAQNLASALNQLAIATRTQIASSSVSLQSHRSTSVNGRYSVAEALGILLQGSSLVAKPVGEQSFTIESASIDQPGAAAVPMAEVFAVGSYIEREKLNTATGLGLKPLETPQSVSIMTAQRIKDQNLSTIADAVNSAVGLTTRAVDNVRNEFMSRGFDVTNYQVDGVPLSWSLAGDSGETIADTSLYERIEFVRGATGLMTGAGDPSASINLVRKHADNDQLSGSVSAKIGSWNHKEVSADVGSGLNASGTMRGRLIAKRSYSESWQDLYKADRTVLYGTLEADLTNMTLLRGGISYDKNSPDGATWGALPATFSDDTETDWKRSTTTSAEWTDWDTVGTNYFINVEHLFNNGWELDASINRLIYTQDSKLLYMYGSIDKDSGEGLATWPLYSTGINRQDSLNVQLKGDFEAFNQLHEFTLGALRSAQNARTYEYNELSYPSSGNFYEWDGSVAEPEWDSTATQQVDMTTTQRGFFAATRLNLSDNLKLIMGARVSSWQRKGYTWGVDTNFGDNGVWVPYVGALYDLSEQHRVYLSHTEIFNPQNARNASGETLEPTTGINQEVGLKSSFLDDQLHTTVNYFRIKQDNLAQALIDADGEAIMVNNNPTEQAYYGAEGTVTKGFEVEVVGQPRDNWNVNLGYTHFDAKDADGERVNTDHAREQFNFFSTYEFTGRLENLVVGGGVDWQGKSYGGTISQDAYALVNLMSRYQISPALSAQFNVNNLLDETYYSQVGFYDQYRYGAPRSGTLSMNYTF
tara:strand:+ start:2187 stop:4592 length:2406 start_codon:yes stop_codon:yes gene_type:complete